MKSRFAFLALAASLLSASAFAEEPAKNTTTTTQAPAKGIIIPAPGGLLTIEAEGQIVAFVSLDDQLKDAQVMFSSDSPIEFASKTGIWTVKGKFNVEVSGGGRSLMHIVLDGGVATLQMQAHAPVATATFISPVPLPLPGEHPGTFCGQSDVNRMVMNTAIGKAMQRQQEEAIRQMQTKTEATKQAPVQPTPATPQK